MAAPAASPVIPIEIPIAAEEMGSVKITPISAEIAIPPKIGLFSTFILTSSPSHFIAVEMYGPTK